MHRGGKQARAGTHASGPRTPRSTAAEIHRRTRLPVSAHAPLTCKSVKEPYKMLFLVYFSSPPPPHTHTHTCLFVRFRTLIHCWCAHSKLKPDEYAIGRLPGCVTAVNFVYFGSSTPPVKRMKAPLLPIWSQ